MMKALPDEVLATASDMSISMATDLNVTGAGYKLSMGRNQKPQE